ncbi:Cytochrome P450 monooxygenase [Apiospora arundinis]
MAATFRPVNIEVKREDSTMAPSPTTPTPTKATFSQRPLPTSPFPQAVQIPESIDEKTVLPQRENSQHSRKSRGDSEDVGMDDSDGEGHDDGAGSDDESVNADGTKSNKKKKSQRFYCTDYPPCNLSFTRSEHLARHIRKHTGERPFQCHCSRRFSRLDNLRQHAQTVHVNEDIPIDSLAATGTRFQRQIRTDRVRQPGRARASTAGSMAGPNRGHSKSLSTSSIGSMGSNLGSREDARRRPPPLVMADPRSRLSLESYHSAGGDSQYSYRAVSPSDFSTPTSATFSTGQSSPRWSGIASPTSTHSRSQSMYTGSRTPGRRLSVPSGGNPFQSPHGASIGRPLFGHSPISATNQGAFSPVASTLGSPTSSVFSRRDSVSNAADEAWRRRTWHPDSSNFNAANTSSRLSQVITPSQFQSPVAGPVTVANPAPQNSIRLPGIESFDPIPHRASSPLRRNPSPMMIDSEASHPPALLPAAESVSEGRRGTTNWDMGLHRGLTRLDIASNTTPPRDGAGTWAQEVNQAVEAEADRVRMNPPTVRFNDNVIIENGHPGPSGGNRAFHQHTMSAPSFTHSREGKRHGWYNGPVIHNEGPPEKIARVERVGRMVHPNISHFTGFPARQPTMPQQPAPANNPTDKDNMLRLQALVAVATSETNATAAY